MLDKTRLLGSPPPATKQLQASMLLQPGAVLHQAGPFAWDPPTATPAWFILLILEGIVLMSHAPESLLDLLARWIMLCVTLGHVFFTLFATLI